LDDQGGREASEARHRLDEDAAWRAIVENYGERPSLDEPARADDERPAPRPVSDDRPTGRDRLDTPASWADEGHFVPPDPPAPQLPEPRRRLAWLGLFGAPLAMLVSVVLGWIYPGWLMMCLVAAFVGGFVYLVATMSRGPRDGGDGSDGDGAVV